LLGNEVAPDVVDQTRDLVQQVIKKVEDLGQSGNPDEKDLDRYLKAHDDLQTVLRVYEGVVDGSETLPLSRRGGGGGARGTGEATAAAEAVFAATAAAAKSNGTAYSGDDNAVENGGAAKNGAAGEGTVAAAATASGGRSSPARGNLLDLEENTPLETSMTGEGAGGMMVAYTDGQFMASTSNSVGGVSGLGGAGFDSSSGAGQGSATASNYASASDTGAVYGSNQFGSINFGSGGGGGDFSSGFAPRDPFAAAFGGSAPSVAAPDVPPGAPDEPAPRPLPAFFPGGLPGNQSSSIVSVTSSSATNRNQGVLGVAQQRQSPSTDFGSWMSSRGGPGGPGDPFAPSRSSAGFANGLLGVPGRHKLYSLHESPSLASSNGGGVGNGGSVMAPGSSLSSSVGGGAGGGGGAFNPFEMTSGVAAPAARAETTDPLSAGANGTGGGVLAVGAAGGFLPPQQQQLGMLPSSTTFASGSSGTNRNRSFSEYSATSSQGPQQPQHQQQQTLQQPFPSPAGQAALPPQQQQLRQQPQQQQQQGSMWWQPQPQGQPIQGQAQQGSQQQPQQQLQQQQQAADPFTGGMGPVAGDPFAQAEAPAGQAPRVNNQLRGAAGSGSFDSGTSRTLAGNSADSSAGFGQALITTGTGGESKYNPFDDPPAATMFGG
ncbi:unnamed protein product, partial [Ectocarpus sp. 13 AM-2016]